MLTRKWTSNNNCKIYANNCCAFWLTFEILLGQVEENDTDVATVVPVNHTSSTINVVFPRQPRSWSCGSKNTVTTRPTVYSDGETHDPRYKLGMRVGRVDSLGSHKPSFRLSGAEVLGLTGVCRF